MRVVDVSSFFSDSCGGIKSYYRAKAHFLPVRGIDCHFIVPGKADGEERFGQATLHRVCGPALPGSAYRLFTGPKRLAELLRRLRPDVVEVGSHYFLPRWVAAVAAELRPRPALVGFFHSDIPRTLVEPAIRWLPGALRARILARAWRFVRSRHSLYQATLVASRVLASEIATLGVPRVEWVGLGVDVDVFSPGRDDQSTDLTVAYAGRLSSDKSFSLLLDAWPHIHAATGARLAVAGDGPQRRELVAYAQTHPEVTYHGCFQRPGDVAAFLRAADLVVTPGARETFSLATAEALACATPVVAPDQGGAAELVSRSGGGACFRAGDATSLAGAAITVLERSPEARAALGRQGRSQIVTEFAWPSVAERLHQAYDRALGQAAV